MPLSQLGKRPGDPWECGRCFSEGSRAVLADDRKPGCHICRRVTSSMALLNLVMSNCYRHIRLAIAVETPLKPIFGAIGLPTGRIYPVVL